MKQIQQLAMLAAVCCRCREPGLFRVVACGPQDAFAFEMDRTEQRFGGAPVVQLVVQYSVVLPAGAVANGREQEAGNGRQR